jgi:hypothetical protein
MGRVIFASIMTARTSLPLFASARTTVVAPFSAADAAKTGTTTNSIKQLRNEMFPETDKGLNTDVTIVMT